MTTHQKLSLLWEDTARTMHTLLKAQAPSNTLLEQAILYALGGKYLRSFFVRLSFLWFAGKEKDQWQPAARAVEYVHSYSLVHDDLPCMDDDDVRRGKPSLHKAFGEAMAVLAGDALQTLAFSSLLGEETYTSRTRVEMTKWLAFASGKDGMILGQVMDISKMKTKDAANIARHKTGKLFSYCLLSGLLMAGARSDDSSLFAKTEEFGLILGEVYQFLDDLEDGESNDTTKLAYFYCKKGKTKIVADIAEHVTEGKELLLEIIPFLLARHTCLPKKNAIASSR